MSGSTNTPAAARHLQSGTRAGLRGGPRARLRAGLRRGMAVGLWAGLLLGTGACAGPSTTPPADRDQAALQALVGDAACRDDVQCRTLPVGSLACGGPASYLPWSTLRSDEAALKAAAAPLAQRRPGSARGEVSICRVLPDPGARCVRDSADSALGTCRLRERSDGSGGALPTR